MSNLVTLAATAMKPVRQFPLFKSVLVALALLVAPLTAAVAEPLLFSTGQTVYVPSYSHIFVGNRRKTFDLTTSLAIRNSDPETPITVTRVDYYDASGRFVEKRSKEFNLVFECHVFPSATATLLFRRLRLADGLDKAPPEFTGPTS